jgi:hypothetical protein
MVDVYKEQIKDLIKIVPDFKRRKKLWIINYQKQKLIKE